MSVGAYPPYSPSDTHYWVPGRRHQLKTTSPLPPLHSIGVHLNTDLMFREAGAATSYDVYLGVSGEQMKLIAKVCVSGRGRVSVYVVCE